MLRSLTITLRACLVTMLLLGLAYPLVVTGLAQTLMPERAGGSVAVDERGRPVGSMLLGQGFEQPHYLQPRPAAVPEARGGVASGGSNLGPNAAALHARVAAIREALAAANPNAGPVPVALATTSASGLDPHLPPNAALWQVARIARARGIQPERVRTLIDDLTRAPLPAVIGPPVVNVLEVNLALDRQFGRPRN